MQSQITTSVPEHDAFGSNKTSASDTSSPLEQILQKLNAFASTSSQPSATMSHISNSAFVATQSPSSSWVIDSRASSHMSGINSFIHNCYLIKHIIILADEFTRPVLEKSVNHPTQSLFLFNSLYVPNFPSNMLSVRQLTKSFQRSIIFSPNCVFQNLRTKKMIGSGHERDGLYHLDIPERAFTSVSSSPL